MIPGESSPDEYFSIGSHVLYVDNDGEIIVYFSVSWSSCGSSPHWYYGDGGHYVGTNGDTYNREDLVDSDFCGMYFTPSKNKLSLSVSY